MSKEQSCHTARHYLHAAVVDDHVFKLYLRVEFGHLLTRVQKQAISQLPRRRGKKTRINSRYWYYLVARERASSVKPNVP